MTEIERKKEIYLFKEPRTKLRGRISGKTEKELGRGCAREKDGACEQARMWKRLKLILY